MATNSREYMRFYQKCRRSKKGLTQEFIDERSSERTYLKLLKNNPEAYRRYNAMKEVYGTP